MINALLKGIFSVITGLISVLLSPIDSLISQYLPSLDSALSSIGQMFTLVSNGFGWVISLTGLSSTAISLIVAYYTFKLTVPLLISLVKGALKWYNILKP